MSQQSIDRPEPIVNLLEKNGRFFFFQPDIGVIASDNGIEGAYEKFLGARRAFWQEANAAGLTAADRGEPATPDSTAPVRRSGISVPQGRGVAAELGLFAAKLLIGLALVAGIGGLVVMRAAEGVSGAVNRTLGASASISLADVSRKAADIVKDIKSLTREEKESLRQSVGEIAREIEPIVDAWRNPPARP